MGLWVFDAAFCSNACVEELANQPEPELTADGAVLDGLGGGAEERRSLFWFGRGRSAGTLDLNHTSFQMSDLLLTAFT